MKILLLTTHFNLGGIGIYVLSLAKGLVQKGHQVFVASSAGDLVSLLHSFGAEHITIDIKTKSEISPKLILARRRLCQIVKGKNIEIIHAHTRVTQVLAHAVAGKTGLPYVTTCHGFFKPRLCRKLFPYWGSRCIAISEAVREHLVNDFGLRKQKIAVVHNGVELNRFSSEKFSRQQREEFKRNYGLSPQAPVIGTVARFSSVKGQRYLIQAMEKVVKASPEAQLLLVGDGPEKNRLINEVNKLGIKKNVNFIPATFDTSVPLSVMDIFAFPSISEGLGLAIIEAQAMGLAVVASDVGGIYTLVKDGVNGLLVHPKDPDALAEAILKLLENKSLIFQMGQRAKEQARSGFSLEQMAEGIEQVYMEALEGDKDAGGRT